MEKGPNAAVPTQVMRARLQTVQARPAKHNYTENYFGKLAELF